MKYTPFLFAVLLASAALSVAAADAPSPAASKLNSLFEDEVIAKGKGLAVKQSELEAAYGEVVAAYAARGQRIPDPQRPVLEYRLLEKIVASKLLTGLATDADKAEALKRFDKAFEETLTKVGGQEAFEQQLKFTGQTMEQFKAKSLEQLVWQVVLERNLGSQAAVSEDDIKKFYTDNPSKFEKPEMVKLNQILVAALDMSKNPPVPLSEEAKAEKLALAKKLKARIEKGEDIAALAKEFSDDNSSKKTGGDFEFPRGTGRVPPEFEAAAFSLEPGQVSGVVETKLGYHIIKLREKVPSEIVSLEKVHDELKRVLENQEIQKHIPEFVEKLKKDNDVVISLPMPEELKGQPKA